MHIAGDTSIEDAVPLIACPQCQAHMRLAVIEPDGADNQDRMFFSCDCGFEYRLSARVYRARVLDRDPPPRK